jgi:hypothetical protein
VLGSLLGAFFVSLLCLSDSNGLDGFRSFGEFFSFYFLGVTTMNPSDSPFEIKALNDDMGHVYEVFCETNDERQRDLSKKQATDPLVEEKMRRLNGEIDRLEQKMQTLANAQKRSARGVPTETFASSDNEEALQHKAAFRRFLKTGQDDGLLSWQTKAMSATSGVDGGFFGEGLENKKRRLLVGSRLGAERIVTPSGCPVWRRGVRASRRSRLGSHL